ncbi:MAG: arginase family protein [Nanoarchaeota archaeon]
MRLYLSPDASHLILPKDQVNESGKPIVFDVNRYDDGMRLDSPFLLVNDSIPSLPDTCAILSFSGTLSLLKKDHPLIFSGTRSMTMHEKAILSARKITTYSMKEISVNGIRETCDAVMANSLRFPQLFIAIDLDILDPAFTGNPSTPSLLSLPGGMTIRELIYFLQRIRLLRNFYGAGITLPKNKQQEQVVVKLLLELA